MGRSIIWMSEPSFRGWGCSDCEWNEPVPTLLSSAEAKSAYDRLAQTKFQKHECSQFLSRLNIPHAATLTDRVRKYIAKGYKPKDAVEIVLEEILLEYRGQPKVIEKARTDADDFMRRIREGLI